MMNLAGLGSSDEGEEEGREGKGVCEAQIMGCVTEAQIMGCRARERVALRVMPRFQT